jgi:hypothetical protein
MLLYSKRAYGTVARNRGHLEFPLCSLEQENIYKAADIGTLVGVKDAYFLLSFPFRKIKMQVERIIHKFPKCVTFILKYDIRI